MTTDINENLTQYSSTEGLRYQITVKNYKSTCGNNCVASWVTLSKEELNKLVIDYLKFKLNV